jgi:tetraacyldisaccharide 4'-kinase
MIKMLSLGRRLIERGAWYFAPFSWIFAAAIFCRNKLYDLKWIGSIRVDCTVVSVGNIVAGGTGKTPFVQMMAAAFASRKVAILSRGYGKIPDEAMLLKRRLPNVKIYVGKDRALNAKRAIEEGSELILLDDGFQHRRLFRDFDIVLERAEDPFGKGHYLPWGFLRDSPKRLRKADAVFSKGRDFRHRAVRILDEKEEEVSIQGWRVGLFSGIASPSSFKKTVDGLGADVVFEWHLGDHEMAHPVLLERFAARCKALGARALITTEKDFIKGPRCSLPIVFIEIEIEWMEGKTRWEKLIAKINQEIDNKSAYDRSDKN